MNLPSQPSPAQMAALVSSMMPAQSPPSIMPAGPQTIHTLQGMISSTVPKPDRFILQAGSPFAGKTYAALSFPNPLVLDFDNKNMREGIPTIPFYDDNFVESIVRRKNPAHPVNRKAALEVWLQQNVGKLKDYTVILDALTNVEVAFHQQVFGVEERWGQNGGLYFGDKLNYFQGVCALLAASGARVIINCHLVPVYTRDSNTGLDIATGKNKAAVTGSTAEKLPSFCTSVVYAYAKIDGIKGTISYFWVLRPCPAFDARTIATKIPPSGEIDITNKSAYEAFRACF